MYENGTPDQMESTMTTTAKKKILMNLQRLCRKREPQIKAQDLEQNGIDPDEIEAV